MTKISLHQSWIAQVQFLFVILAASVSFPAAANTWCVSTAADLRAKLVLAQSNGEDDTIKLVHGTYVVNTDPFKFQSTETFGLVINGGFNVDCSQTVKDPRRTILDGAGIHQVFYSVSKGNLALRYLTIQNGRFDAGAGGGIQISGTGSSSSVVLGINILRNNSSAYADSVGFIDVEGTVHVNNNLIVDNHTPAAGGLSISAGPAAIAYVTNNTIANNMTGNTTAGFLYIENNNPAEPYAYVSNNIMWNNIAGSDVQFFGGVQFNNNDIGLVSGFQTDGSGANTSQAPGFVSSSDYHLAGTSSLLAIGLFAPTGGLPMGDLEGHARDFNGLVDLGAYERGDEIFADGFEP